MAWSVVRAKLRQSSPPLIDACVKIGLTLYLIGAFKPSSISYTFKAERVLAPVFTTKTSQD